MSRATRKVRMRDIGGTRFSAPGARYRWELIERRTMDRTKGRRAKFGASRGRGPRAWVIRRTGAPLIRNGGKP